jgi:hypothetical protein
MKLMPAQVGQHAELAGWPSEDLQIRQRLNPDLDIYFAGKIQTFRGEAWSWRHQRTGNNAMGARIDDGLKNHLEIASQNQPSIKIFLHCNFSNQQAAPPSTRPRTLNRTARTGIWCLLMATISRFCCSANTGKPVF